MRCGSGNCAVEVGLLTQLLPVSGYCVGGNDALSFWLLDPLTTLSVPEPSLQWPTGNPGGPAGFVWMVWDGDIQATPRPSREDYIEPPIHKKYGRITTATLIIPTKRLGFGM